MTKLVWGQTDQPRYQEGVDRGVLYPSNGPGVVWNGLVSVEESVVGGENNPYYFDGIKYLDVVSPKNYQANVTAFFAPEEFSPCIGEKSVIPGFVLTRQPRERFNFSYRSLLGDDLGYKLHLVYNASASPSNRSYVSIDPSSTPSTLAWKIDAVPPPSDTYRPSAHFVLDSTKMDSDALEAIETMLYGSDTLLPHFPNITELIDIMAFWGPVIIVPSVDAVYIDGGLSYSAGVGIVDGGIASYLDTDILDSEGMFTLVGVAHLVQGVGDLYKTKIDGIYRALPNTRLYKSPVAGVYRME